MQCQHAGSSSWPVDADDHPIFHGPLGGSSDWLDSQAMMDSHDSLMMIIDDDDDDH